MTRYINYKTIIVISIFIIFITYLYVDPESCFPVKYFYKTNIKGRVVKTEEYLDKEKGIKSLAIYIVNNKDTIYFKYSDRQSSYIPLIKDSLYKNNNSFKFDIYRDGRFFCNVDNIFYDCYYCN